ncbi:MAG: flagellar assembly protein FliW [Oscillospiraceae bacterium]|jgi:flagellar assembly factor FliW|nr:flagellar assembly protein FliW [Oscillospiraceae bacterium]
MELKTIRFGMVEIDESKILSFPNGLPGLEDNRRFALLNFEDSFPLFWLQAVDDEGVCLPVINSFMAFKGYAFDIDDADCAELKIENPGDVQVMSVVVIPEDIEKMTANLAAPIIVNTESGLAKQIILGGAELGIRVPVFAEVCRLIREVGANADTVAESE